MKNDRLENRMRMLHNREKISDEKLLMGSTRGKFPVVMDGGKTVIYISDESKANETRLKYKLLRDSRFPTPSENNNT
jgi:hypothetical protein